MSRPEKLGTIVLHVYSQATMQPRVLQSFLISAEITVVPVIITPMDSPYRQHKVNCVGTTTNNNQSTTPLIHTYGSNDVSDALRDFTALDDLSNHEH